MIISGWGRYHKQDCTVTRPRDLAALSAAVVSGPSIARGNGRSYGDSAQNRVQTVDMRGFNRMLSFDSETGILVAESGVMLADIITHLMPRGWFPLVTPGTRYVTLGGMVAADVHGKNHHLDGAFGRHIVWLDVMGADGIIRRADRQNNSELFFATIGGMGLTGVVVHVALKLRRVESGWINQRAFCAPDIDSIFEAFETHSSAPYTVAWIDCLGRGKSLGRSVLFTGEHAPLDTLDQHKRACAFPADDKKGPSLPFDLPTWALNRWSLRLFNSLYYRLHQNREQASFVSWYKYFYPLDRLQGWNRLYGRQGFFQYQCVLPLDQAKPSLKLILERISDSGLGSFLAVLKKLGPDGEGQIGFPMEGYTLALDFAASPDALALMGQLDSIVTQAGGRLYLAKDGRVSSRTLREMDPRIPAFTSARTARGETHFQSSQSERLHL